MVYRKRTSFQTGLIVAQLSEFSLILGSMALSLVHIDAPMPGLITLVEPITIGVSTYIILFSHQQYQWLWRWLRLFERRIPHAGGPDQDEVPDDHTADI